MLIDLVVHGEHLGSHVRVLAETRLLTRMGTRWTLQTIMLRLECLPCDHPAARVVAAAARSVSDTWWDHVEQMMKDLGVERGISDVCASAWPPKPDNASRKVVAKRYKTVYVRPRLAKCDRQWFVDGIARLNNEGLVPYND